MKKLILILIALLVISGCGTSEQPEQAQKDSPKQAYLTYISAIERGDYIRAENILASSIKEQMLLTATALGKTKDVVLEEIKFKMDLNQYNGMDQSSLREEIDGNRAKVHFKSKADAETAYEAYYSLQNENGDWKLEQVHMTIIP